MHDFPCITVVEIDMQTRRAIWIDASWGVLLSLLLPCIVRACVTTYATAEVGRTFRVGVTDRGSPVKALRLVLGSSRPSAVQGDGIVHSLTNEDGFATFSDVNPGSFLLTVENEEGAADAVVVNVSSKGPTNVTVPLRWPSRTPMSVRSMAGTVRGPDYYPSQVQARLSLSLLEGLSARVIAKTVADSKGRFKFPDEIPAGIYFLRLNRSDLRGWSGEQMEGIIPVEVSPKAEQQALDIDLGWSSCGLGYAQREEHPELKLDKICGDIADSEGAVVSDAQVLLVASGKETQALKQTKSGVKGQFAFEVRHNGAYQLIIKSAGFQPFLSSIRVEVTAPGESCRNPIRAILKVM